MIVKIAQHAARFLFLILVQVIVLNHIQWSGFVNPYVYPLFILLLPVEIPNALLLTLAFLTGLTVDMFGDSGGLHAAATVALAFARPSVLRLLAPRDGYDAEVRLSPQMMGWKWFATYLGLLLFLHHFVLFYLEAFRFSEFFYTLFKVLVNVLISGLMIIMGQYLFGKAVKRNERILG